ncbi:MAG: thioredoxin domain-containing protein [Alphaproteobacteria bacterium]
MDPKQKKIAIIAGVAVIALLGLFMVTSGGDQTPRQTVSPVEQIAQDDDITNTEENGATAAIEGTEQSTANDSAAAAPTEQAQAEQAQEAVTIDVERALAVRGLGDPNAPLTVKEFSSFTCGHCGEFHKSVFDQFKSEFIDTGKVYLIFSDFPLNGPAMHASMVSRCLPEERYFNFVDMLFKNQDDWAYDQNYIDYLRRNASLAGLGQAAFDACINNSQLRDGIVAGIRSAQEKYEINSTPTLVINETDKHTGAQNFAYYKGVIEAALAALENGSDE